MMRTFILLAFLSCAVFAAGPGRALAQPAPAFVPPEPTTTAATSGSPNPGPRARSGTSSAQPGGIYARPGRCRELAINRRLHGLARQRFIKRCRIARRSMPRPVPSTAAPASGAPAPSPAAPPPARP